MPSGKSSMMTKVVRSNQCIVHFQELNISVVHYVAKRVPLPDSWGLSPTLLAQIDVVTGRVACRHTAHLAGLSAYLSYGVFLSYDNAFNHHLYCDRKALIKLVNLGGRNLAPKDMRSTRIET